MELFVHGLYRDEEAAAAAVQALVDAHFNPDAISALMHGPGTADEARPQFKTSFARGAVLGAALGAVGGALIAASGLLAAGPVLGVVAGTEVGAAAGALGGMGLWRDEVHFPKCFGQGMYLVGVMTEARSVERARGALEIAEPERVHVSRKNEACVEVQSYHLAEGGVL